MSSPTARTLARLRRLGYVADVVERWLAPVQRRKDYLGCIDIIAAKSGEPVLALQATSLSNVSARVKKARAAPGLTVWLATGHASFQVWGWAKQGDRWGVKVVELRAADLAAVVIEAPRRRRRPGRGERQGLLPLFGDTPNADGATGAGDR